MSIDMSSRKNIGGKSQSLEVVNEADLEKLYDELCLSIDRLLDMIESLESHGDNLGENSFNPKLK